MTPLLLVLVALTCVLILAHNVWRNRPFELPFLAVATTFSFALPQLIGIYRSSVRLVPEAALNKTLIMVFLCIGMLWWGWRGGSTGRFSDWSRLVFQRDKLIVWTWVLALIGMWGNWKIHTLPEELTKAKLWSGLPVAFLFFAVVLGYGYALAANLWLSRKSRSALVIIAVAGFVYLNVVVFGGRRQPAAEFLLIPACAYWFVRRRELPRSASIAVIVAMLLLLPSTGEYRAVATASAHERDWDKLRDIPFMGNLQATLKSGGLELTNAAVKIEAVDRTRMFDFGLSIWNAMVFSYVPRQIVGQAFKESLMVDLPAPEYYAFGYLPVTGSTWTGFAAAFASFGYFGCLLFYGVGWIMGRVYGRAMRGDMVAQVVYSVTLVQSALVVTHSTAAFFTPWPHIAAFLFPGLYWARRHLQVNPRVIAWAGRRARIAGYARGRDWRGGAA